MANEPESVEPAEEKTREELEQEVEQLRAELVAGRTRVSQRVRSVASLILVILTAISVTVAAVSWWVHYVVFNTDAFMEVVEPAVTSDEFSLALGTRVGEEAVTALDLENRLETRLSAIDAYISEQLVDALNLRPRVQELLQGLDVPRFADLAGPLAAAANERIETAIQNVVSSDAFETVLVGAIRRGHAGAVALVQDDLASLPNVYIEDDELKWNAIPLIVSTVQVVIEQGLLGGEEITLPDFSDNPIASAAISRLAEALGTRLPEDLGQFTLMSSDELATLQSYGDMLDRGVWLAIILAIVLFAVTLAISPNRRRTLIQLSVATVIAIVLAGLAVRAAVSSIQSNLVTPEGRAAAGTVFAEIQSSARSLGVAIIVVAILIGVLTWLAGRPEQIEKWIAAGRKATDRGGTPSQADQFVGRHFDVLAVVAVILTLVVVWVADPNWLWGLVIVAVLGALLWYGISARARYELSTTEVEEAAEDSLPV